MRVFIILLLITIFSCSENEREKTVLALENTERAFDAFGNTTNKFSVELATIRTQINSKVVEINYDSTTTPIRKALTLSDEINASICTSYAKKISDLKSKFNNIEDSCTKYLSQLDTLLNEIKEAKQLYSKMLTVVNQVKNEYKQAKSKADLSIVQLEEKYIEMCHYKEAIIILSTVRALKEKIKEFLAVAGEAEAIINELNEFAKDGKAIISQPVTNI